jgi:ferredoxin
LVDLTDIEDRTTYCLPPPMAGFFEFTMMRVQGDIDKPLLFELLHQYINVEEDFMKSLFIDGDTQFGRTLVHEPSLSEENAVHVLDYERASQLIKDATCLGVGRCFCRHKMEHAGKACNAPQDICMTLNTNAQSLVKHGIARKIDTHECLDLLQQAYAHNLVQFGENVQRNMNFICNCCGCCCDLMTAARRFGMLQPVHTTNFVPDINEDLCSGCGKCVQTCPVEAMSLVSANDPEKPKRNKARLNASACLGCGLCVRNCASHSIQLTSRSERVITPVDSVHRLLVMAVERGKLQNFVFDNQVSKSHRALAAVFGAILRLSPIQQWLARKQLKSRYLESLFGRVNPTIRRYIEKSSS